MTEPAAPLANPGPDGLTPVHRGKVRELYRAGDGRLVMVASDRISAFDFVFDTPIPDKGRVLTALSSWWFDRLAEHFGDAVPTHVQGATDDPVVPPQWRGRATVCSDLAMAPVEAVARGYLAGSGWVDYQRDGAVCGVALPDGLRDGDRLPEPIFTPATKAALGEHDENISFDALAATVGGRTLARIRDLTLQVYGWAADVAAGRGILLADTKFEFGTRQRADGTDELVLADEVLTPDSSRFWPAETWSPGGAQVSYDKQYLRDWLLSPASGWDREAGGPPPLQLPDDVVAATRARYVEAYERLTGLDFTDWPG